MCIFQQYNLGFHRDFTRDFMVHLKHCNGFHDPDHRQSPAPRGFARAQPTISVFAQPTVHFLLRRVAARREFAISFTMFYLPQIWKTESTRPNEPTWTPVNGLPEVLCQPQIHKPWPYECVGVAPNVRIQSA